VVCIEVRVEEEMKRRRRGSSKTSAPPTCRISSKERAPGRSCLFAKMSSDAPDSLCSTVTCARKASVARCGDRREGGIKRAHNQTHLLCEQGLELALAVLDAHAVCTVHNLQPHQHS
jgi:hypothetical protein